MPETVLCDKSGHPLIQLADDGVSLIFSTPGSPNVGGSVSPTQTGRVEGATAAITNLLTVNVPHNADRSYEVAGYVRPTVATSHAFTMTVAYTDEGGTARTLTLTFGLVAGGALSTTS